MTVDVAVLGVGVMGAAVARALARAGRDVLMLEQFEVGHTRGSSHGRSRVFRFSYDDPIYVRMAREALPLWRELEDEAGDSLLSVTGGLDHGPMVDTIVEALRADAVDFEIIDGAEAMRRYPVVSLPRDERVVFQKDAGFLAADEAWKALAESAVRHGADLREAVMVEAVRPSGERVEIATSSGTHLARIAVVTAGGWARSLLAGAGIELPVTPTRETVAYCQIEEGVEVPIVLDWRDPVAYALPSPGQGIKTAEHHAGPPTDPENEGTPSEESLARLKSWVAERFPSAAPTPHHVETCIYTNTTDDSFVLERHGPIVVGSPCSGHGFKFAPLIGERLAALVSAAAS
ncbi:MAG: N-methyl-L-tryptophan oxidase [Actinomycetota bacterium]